jgi:hypothetical protein
MLQKETNRILSEIYNGLNENLTVEGIELLKEKVRQIIRIESRNVSKGKFSWYDYVADDKLRPVMNGVYYDQGYKVVSDCRVLLAVKESYDESLEGKIEAKDGSFIEGRYPNWRAVIPNDIEGCRHFEINESLFYDKVKDLRAEYKAATGKGCRWSKDWFVKFDDLKLSAEQFDKFIRAMKQYNRTTFYNRNNRRCAFINDEDFKLLLMPCDPDFTDEDECKFIDMTPKE